MAANPQPTPEDVPIEKLAELYYDRQLTLVEIEKELDGKLSATCARRRLTRAGYKLRPSTARPKLCAEDKAEIIKLGREGHHPPGIAARFGVSASLIYLILAEAEVPAPRSRELDTDAIVKDALEGLSAEQLAKKYKRTKRTLLDILRDAGVCRPRGGGGHRRHRQFPIGKEREAAELYQNDKKSGPELALKYNVTLWTFYDVLRKLGVTIRDTSEAAKVTQNRDELRTRKGNKKRKWWEDRKAEAEQSKGKLAKLNKDVAAAQERIDRLTQELKEAKAEKAKAKAAKAEVSPIAETVRVKLAEPDKYPWMSPDETAAALGNARSTFFKKVRRGLYSRLRQNTTGQYKTTSVNEQLKNLPRAK